ncbi:DEKNAAC101374 [Brettanomyces naardenensis]|uniref:DEKNAAC101374 n=1 Tax=Brettanomyces naardenensis TaxID=13370 RepID=A0A448YHQ2_BRENA|nr:DEKNAAC101374 [Brettanomyces naardenensis]
MNSEKGFGESQYSGRSSQEEQDMSRDDDRDLQDEDREDDECADEAQNEDAPPGPPSIEEFQELDIMNDDYGESVIIDKNEMVETSDDQDLLSSPSSKLSFEGDTEQDIDGFTNLNIILEYPRLNADFQELGSFEDEVQDWFSSNDLKGLKSVKLLCKNVPQEDSEIFIRESAASLQLLLHSGGNCDEEKLLRQVINLSYLVMGGFGTADDQNDIIQRMIFQSSRLVSDRDIIKLLSEIVKSRANKLADSGNCETPLTHKTIQMWSNQLFYSLTILHIIVLTYLKNLNANYEQKSSLVELFDEEDLLGSVTKAIDKWRWISCESEDSEPSSIIDSISNTNGGNYSGNQNNNTSSNGEQQGGKKSARSQMSLSIIMAFKLRNVVIFFNDLILLQFGNLDQLRSTKEFLAFRNCDSKQTNATGEASLRITPLDYRRYRDELTTRYPTFTPPKYEISRILDASISNDEDVPEMTLPDLTSSISMLSSQGTLNKKRESNPGGNNVFSNPPDIHIATPMPSPTLTPQHTGSSAFSNTSEYERVNGDVKKKLFMTQSDFPNIYPFEKDVPYSIKEATDIFYHHVKDDFYSKQFVSTFEEFVQEEKGVSRGKGEIQKQFFYADSDIEKDPMFEPEIRSLQRVEKFYNENLPYLSSLIYVLIQIVSSNVLPAHADDRRFRQRGQRSQAVFPYPPEESSDELRGPYFVKDLTPSDKQRLEVIRMKESTLKSASTIILMLSKWFKLSHILKFEYFAALLFDNNFISQSFRVLDSNKVHSQWGKSYDFKDPESLINNRLVYCDYQVLYRLKEYNFFIKALSLSDTSLKPFEPDTTEQEACEGIFQFKDGAASESMLSFILPFNAQCNISVENPNRRYCLIVTNLFKTVYGMISHFKIQRIYRLLEVRPTDTLRFYLTLFNESLYKPILKIIKLMSPFSGKKWRANNMDLISFVYLFYKVGLKDRWLTNYFTGSLEERLKVSYENEFALRCLLKYYNVRNYSGTLKKFGYSSQDRDFMKDLRKSDDDFFDSQMDKIVSDEFQGYLKIEE